jgi:hypothetical protein
MTILSKTTYRSTSVLIEIPIALFTEEFRENILKFVWNHKKNKYPNYFEKKV